MKSVTLEECLNKRQIIKYFDALDIKYQGINYTINVGDTFGRLEVIYLVSYMEGTTKRKGCICKCSCTDNSYIGPSRLHMLLNGDLVSCGCYSKDIHRQLMINNNTKHGYTTRSNREHLYTIWGAMIDRAENSNRKDAKYYANKGITVCNEWRSSYENFRDWAINNGYKDGLSIDRKDNSLGYCPENCRWINIKYQNSNKTNNRILEYNGQCHTITEWCRIIGKSWTYIDSRLKSGKTVGQALGYEK